MLTLILALTVSQAPVPPLLAIAVPFLAATLCTPLIVQARKPLPQAAPLMKDAVPMDGATFAL